MAFIFRDSIALARRAVPAPPEPLPHLRQIRRRVRDPVRNSKPRMVKAKLVHVVEKFHQRIPEAGDNIGEHDRFVRDGRVIQVICSTTSKAQPMPPGAPRRRRPSEHTLALVRRW